MLGDHNLVMSEQWCSTVACYVLLIVWDLKNVNLLFSTYIRMGR